MKTDHIYRKTVYSLLLTALLGFVWITSCTKENVDERTLSASDVNDEFVATSGTATGSQQVPPVATDAQAKLSGIYNKTTNQWEYDIEWARLSAASNSIEVRGPADFGAEGPLVFSTSISGTQGSGKQKIGLSATQEEHLLNNRLYFTVVNANYPKGEARAQIIVNAR
jgi:hypothetical protein